MKKQKYNFLVFFAMLAMMPFLLVGCQGKTSNVQQKTANNASDGSVEQTAVAVVKQVDADAGTVVLRDTGTQEEQTFSYNGATTIYSKNSVAMVMTQLSCGEIVEVSYDGVKNLLTNVQVSKDAWEYCAVKGADIDRTDNDITVTGRKYQYDNTVSVFSGQQSATLMDLNEQDEITIKGIGTKVQSFQITKGHGFLRLAGQDAFIGGTIEVDQSIFLNVQDDMLITVGEGEHTVVLRNGKLEAVENITVEKDQEILLDLSEYEPLEEKEGKVKFVVTPSGAALYINGKQRNTNQVLTLAYGNYNVTVRADGYEDYTGILHVQKSAGAYQTIYVDLVEEKEEVQKMKTPTVTPSVSAGTSPKNQTDATAIVVTKAPETTKAPDEQHTITVKAPIGASVYVNGIYQGVAPITFSKVLGNATITLSKEGYVTRSYSVNIADDGKDVNYSFAALIAE